MARDRTIHNNVVIEVASPIRARRGEVLGVERRRKWPDETRISIVSEALEPGAIVSHVARRHDINPSQLFGWMKRYRADAMALRPAKAAIDVPTFAPAVLDVGAFKKNETEPVSVIQAVPERASIEISIGAATVRIRGVADAKTLATVLKALRTLA